MQFRFKNATVFEGLIVLLCVLAAALSVYRHFVPTVVPAQHTVQESVPAAQLADQSEIVESGVSEDGIPSLDYPTFISPTQALDELGREGHGLVVVRGAAARFYPYQILTWHEVINDEIGGASIAVTYCALCNVGVVYNRNLGGERLSFGVSGKVQDLDSLLFDRTTHSLWSQVTGEALKGPLRGKKLAVLESSVMSLKEFSVAYPNGGVLSKFTGFVRNYDDLSYGDYATAIGGEKIIAAKKLLHPKTMVVGVAIVGKAKAYPAEVLKDKIIVDSFAGMQVRVDGSGGPVTVTNGSTGEPLAFSQMYWFLWQAWHPETVVYR